MKIQPIALTVLLAPAAALAQSAPPAPPAAPAPVEVTAYGTLVTEGYYDHNPVVNDDVPTAAAAAGPEVRALGFTARQSRFGVQVNAPSVAQTLGAASVKGVFEADFYGGYFTGGGNTYYTPLPRLRLFNVTMDYGNWKLLVGQDWSIFAPLNPDSLTHMEIPGFSGTGNLWERLPQVRGEATMGALHFAVAVGASADNSGIDNKLITSTGCPAPGGMAPEVGQCHDPNAAEQSQAPGVDGRLWYAGQLQDSPMAVGVSGHYGRAHYVMGQNVSDVPIWGVAGDLSLSFMKLVSLKGEIYQGSNLSGFYDNGGVFGMPGMMAGSTSTGGWAQVGVKPGKLGVWLGYGVDDVKAPSNYTFKNGSVNLNSASYLSVTYALAAKTSVGVEYDMLHTSRIAANSNVATDANAFSGVFQFGF